MIGDDVDDFRGIVYVPSVVGSVDELRSGDATIDDLAAPPMTIEADTDISDAVDRFQDEHQELALVVDDRSAVVGLITATDALDAVMGEIEDPLDIELGGRD